MNSISSIFSIVASWSKHFTSKRFLRKRAASNLDKNIQRTLKAIKDGDEDEVNRRLNKHILLTAFSCLWLSGCVSSEVIYVPDSQKAVRMEQKGVKGWFVPDAVLSILLEKAARYDQMKQDELNKE